MARRMEMFDVEEPLRLFRERLEADGPSFETRVPLQFDETHSQPLPIFRKGKEHYPKGIHFLPHEVMLRIFSRLDLIMLSRCAQVCRAWNVLALDKSLWGVVDLHWYEKNEEYGTCIHVPMDKPNRGSVRFPTRRGKWTTYKKGDVNRNIKDWVIEMLAFRSGSFLNTLFLRDCSYVTDESMRILAEECRNIETLNLSRCHITNKTIVHLAANCHRLKKLDIADCYRLTDMSMCVLSSGCKQLEYIDISSNDLTDRGISTLCMECPNITHFISRFLILQGSCISQLASSCPKLEVVDISYTSVTDPLAVAALGEHCPMLEVLHTRRCQWMIDDVLIAVADGCQNLRSLELKGCENVFVPAVQHMTQKCPELRRLDVGSYSMNFDFQTMECISQYCHHLCDLDVSGSVEFSEDCLILIGTSPSLCQTLKVLGMQKCNRVYDEGLRHLATCSALRCLKVSYDGNISKTGTNRLQALLRDLCVHVYSEEVLYPTSAGNRRGRQRRRLPRCCIS